MSKGARRTGRFRRPSRRGVPRRTSRGRPIRRTILIVGEGQETEPNYFRELAKEDEVKRRFAVTIKKGPGISPERVIEETIKHKQRADNRGESYDEVWCVLDVEGPTKRESLDKAAITAQDHSIKLCLSNPAFEVWLLSHFERKARAYDDCDAVIVQLNKHWRKHYKQDYQKNDGRVYLRVSPLTQTAIGNAQWVRENHHKDKQNTADCNSSTEVYRLVRQLIG